MKNLHLRLHFPNRTAIKVAIQEAVHRTLKKLGEVTIIVFCRLTCLENSSGIAFPVLVNVDYIKSVMLDNRKYINQQHF